MRKWNSLAIIGIVLLLALGYSIPSVVMALEDGGREAVLKSYEIEEIQLSFQNVDIVEVISIFPEMLLNHVVVEQTDAFITARPNEESQVVQNYTESEVENRDRAWIENSIDAFIQVLQSDSSIEFVDFKATYYVMMVSNEDERVYPIWECLGMDTENREYRFWLDDFSGTVLGCSIPYEMVGRTDKELNMTMERMGKYYGSEIFGLAESITGAYKMDSWQNTLMLFDQAGNEQNRLYLFKIGDRLWFNVYPGSVSVYSTDTHKQNDAISMP